MRIADDRDCTVVGISTYLTKLVFPSTSACSALLKHYITINSDIIITLFSVQRDACYHLGNKVCK
jgi:hypothetical protein